MTLSRKHILSLIIVAIAGSLLYFLFDPSLSNLFPKCIFHSLTNLDCPGCGSQRAIHALLNGRVIQAADFNLLAVLALLSLVAAAYGLIELALAVVATTAERRRKARAVTERRTGDRARKPTPH